jgi:hypothetical protein
MKMVAVLVCGFGSGQKKNREGELSDAMDRLWKVPRASVYRSLKETQPNTISGRPVQSAHVRSHYPPANSRLRLHGEGYRKLWAPLRFADVRASPGVRDG